MPICQNPLHSPPEADRVLVIRLGALGDVVRTLPAASALRAAWPGAHLAWLVEPASRGVVEGQPWLDEVLVFPRGEIESSLRGARLGRMLGILGRFVWELRRRRFDLVVDFHSIAKSGLLARATGARQRVAYAPPFGREGASWWLATARAELAPARLPRAARNRALVEFLGVRTAALPAPFTVDPEARRRVAAQLGAGARARVALHPGTSAATPHKRWPAEGFAAVARALAAEGLDAIVTRGPGPEEEALAAAVLAAAGGAARPAPPTPSIAELAALLERCQLLVAGDSGPLHLASLVGTPGVQLLGPTDPVENEPLPGTPARSVRAPVACSPCRRGCAAAPCMRRIRPEEVLGAARALLATPAGRW